MFQFLIGSLEALIAEGWLPLVEFQFLIGSLEASIYGFLFHFFVVSIPHR